MLRYGSSVLYYVLYWKLIDRLFYLLPLPFGPLSACLQLFALCLGLALCFALGNFTANRLNRQNWWTQT